MIIKTYNASEQGVYIGSPSTRDVKLDQNGNMILRPNESLNRPPEPKSGKIPMLDKVTKKWTLVDNYYGVEYWDSEGVMHKIMSFGVKPPEDAVFEKPQTIRGKEVDNARREQYAIRVDPLMSEALIKREMGDKEGADAEILKAISERHKIQQEIPR